MGNPCLRATPSKSTTKKLVTIAPQLCIDKAFCKGRPGAFERWHVGMYLSNSTLGVMFERKLWVFPTFCNVRSFFHECQGGVLVIVIAFLFMYGWTDSEDSAKWRPLNNSWPAHVKEFRFWASRKNNKILSLQQNWHHFFVKNGGNFRNGDEITSPRLRKKIGPKFDKKLLDLVFFAYGGFLKCWGPRTIGFPTKTDHFEVFWGYHHLRKHPYPGVTVGFLKVRPRYSSVPVAGPKVGASIWLNSPVCFRVFWDLFLLLPIFSGKNFTINLVMNLKDFWILILGASSKDLAETCPFRTYGCSNDIT